VNCAERAVERRDEDRHSGGRHGVVEGWASLARHDSWIVVVSGDGPGCPGRRTELADRSYLNE
jgi:hypothetical protein